MAAAAGCVQPVRGDLRVWCSRSRTRPTDPGSPTSAATPTTRCRGATSAPRRWPCRTSTRTPTGCAGPVRRVGDELAGDLLGRGPRPRRRQPRPGGQRARTGRAGDLPRQPQRAQPRLDDARHRDGEVLPHPQQVQRHLGRPAARADAGLPDVRPPADAAGARPGPHRALPGVRREPDGLQRQPDDRAGLPRPAAGAQGPRRPDGRGRPAPHRDRPGRARAPLRASGHRRLRAARDAARALRGGPHHSPVVRRRAGRGPHRRPAVHPRARRDAPAASTRTSYDAWRGSSRPRSPRRSTAGSGCPPRSSAWSPPGRCSCSTWSPATWTAPAA